MTTKQPARTHPYAPADTSVATPRLHGGHPQTTRMMQVRRAQTVLLPHSRQSTSSVANVPPTRGNVVRRSHTAPSLGAASRTNLAPQASRPSVHAGATPSGRQRPLPAVLDRRFSVESVEGLPAASSRGRQPTPTPSSPYVSVAPYASPVVQVQTAMSIPGSPRVHTPSATVYQVQTTPAHESVPLHSIFDQHLPAQTTSTTTTVPVATSSQDFDVGPSRPLSPNSFMDFLRTIPTPSVTDVLDVDAFLDAILALQTPAPVVPEDNWPLPDAFQTWSPGQLSEYWLNGGYPTGWEDFMGFPDQ